MTDEDGIVDTHFHFQRLGAGTYPWLEQDRRDDGLEGDLTEIARDFGPADYAAVRKTLGITRAVHVENGWRRDDPVAETRWLASLGSDAPDAIVAWADLRAPDVAQRLDAHLAAGPVRGIRQILNRHPDPRLSTVPGEELMYDTAWRSGFSELAPRKLCFDLQIYPHQLGAAESLAVAFPQQHIVLGHIGMPIARNASDLAEWHAGLRALARHCNVWLKLSGGWLGQPRDPRSDPLPLYLKALDAFGPDRCMLGTNLPVDCLWGGAPTIGTLWERLFRHLSSDEKVLIQRQNAEEFYRLKGSRGAETVGSRS